MQLKKQRRKNNEENIKNEEMPTRRSKYKKQKIFSSSTHIICGNRNIQSNLSHCLKLKRIFTPCYFKIMMMVANPESPENPENFRGESLIVF